MKFNDGTSQTAWGWSVCRVDDGWRGDFEEWFPFHGPAQLR
jgi:hypothetical protein